MGIILRNVSDFTNNRDRLIYTSVKNETQCIHFSKMSHNLSQSLIRLLGYIHVGLKNIENIA